MLFAHSRLKVGGGEILRMRLMATPLHEEAVADATQQAGDKHGGRTTNAAPVVVLRDIQPLVQTVFDAAKARPVEFEPSSGVEFAWLSAAQQGDLFLLATLRLAQQARRLCRQRKANLLRRDGLGENGAADQTALVVMQSAELSGRRLPRGENPLWGRAGVARYFDER